MTGASDRARPSAWAMIARLADSGPRELKKGREIGHPERLPRAHRLEPQSSSASRFTAGATGFLTLSQWSIRPERYGVPSRFETMPSQPMAQACL